MSVELLNVKSPVITAFLNGALTTKLLMASLSPFPSPEAQ